MITVFFRYCSGDFVTAIGLVIKVIKALDSGGGATKHYREATAFLQNPKDTIEPLQASTLFEAYPTYGELVRQ